MSDRAICPDCEQQSVEIAAAGDDWPGSNVKMTCTRCPWDSR